MLRIYSLVAAACLAAAQSVSAQRVVPALDATLRKIAATTKPLAFAVVVVRGDSVIHAAGYGSEYGNAGARVTAESPFYIASSTKSFTALTATLLAARGVVDLDAPISRYAPEFTLPPPLDPGRITLRRLLSHRGGFESGPLSFRTAYVGDVPADSLLPLLGRTAEPVDSTFTYTNTAFIIAARVLERATGVPWQDLVEREIIKPLGLGQTTARPSSARTPAIQGFGEGPGGHRKLDMKPDATMHAAGGMLMSASDAALWLRAQLNDGRVGSRQVFPIAVVRETHRRFATQKESVDGIDRFGYALGWQMGVWQGDTLYHHFGNYPGAFAHVSFMPSQRTGVAVFFNTEVPAFASAITTIAQMAYDAALNRHDRDAVYATYPDSLGAAATRMFTIFRRDNERRAARPTAPPRGWSAYVGTYTAPEMGSLGIVLAGDGAEIRYGASKSRLEVLSGDTLRIAMPPGRGGSPGPVTFDASGRVASIVVAGRTFTRSGTTPGVRFRSRSS
jgi:CubicO group peptidase (beta-lactamase class C family)